MGQQELFHPKDLQRHRQAESRQKGATEERPRRPAGGIDEERLRQSLLKTLNKKVKKLVTSTVAEKLPSYEQLVADVAKRVVEQFQSREEGKQQIFAGFDQDQLIRKILAQLNQELEEKVTEQLSAVDLPGMVAEEVIRVAANFRSQLASRAAPAPAPSGQASVEERLRQVPTREELDGLYVSREEFEQLQTHLAYSQRRLVKVKRENAFDRRYVFPRPDGKRGVKFHLLQEDLQRFYGPHWHEIFQEYRKSEAPETLPLEFRQHLVELEQESEKPEA